MFEIRVICEDHDAPKVTETLSAAFTAGAVRRHRMRDGRRTRLYVTADHRPAGPWPTPEAAYAQAPSIISEIGWTAHEARRSFDRHLGREFWVRKAAVLDRIALSDEAEGLHGDAGDLAAGAARRLIDLDRAGDGNYHGTPYWPEHPETAVNPRAYVRQEYAAWLKRQ
ncbi:hypothetical protein [Streptomyces sp. 8N706]|uniref:hypothetical protein n=1 Tax=Streptomyces sp. 8N706 TaxID=3457416 RepID=UPI003FD13460